MLPIQQGVPTNNGGYAGKVPQRSILRWSSLVCLLITFVIAAIALALGIVALVQNNRTNNSLDEHGDDCIRIRGFPGEDPVGHLSGRFCSRCADDASTFVYEIEYSFQPGSLTESLFLLNTFLSLTAVSNGLETIRLCKNTTTADPEFIGTAPLCPDVNPGCTGSCKWTGVLTAKGDTAVEISEERCRVVASNLGAYVMAASTDATAFAAAASLGHG